MAKRLALLVGNTEFEDVEYFPHLSTPANDVRDLADLLAARGEFKIVEQLVDRDADALRQGIEDFYRSAQRGDLTLFYYSGHGFRNEDGALCLVARNTRVNQPLSTSLQESFLSDVMRFSRSQHRVVILDCCFSGAFPADAKAGPEALVFDKLQGQTTAVLSSSSRVQFSFTETGPNSLFTKYLIEGIQTERADRNRDRQITIDELFAYAEARVRALRPEQTPTLKLHEQMDRVVIAKTSPLPQDWEAAWTPLVGLMAQALAAERLLSREELAQLAAQQQNPAWRLTEEEKRLILLSSLAVGQGVPGWLHLDQAEGLALLRAAHQNNVADEALHLAIIAQLALWEDEPTWAGLLAEAAINGAGRTAVHRLATFAYHSQKERPLPLRFAVPIQTQIARLRRQAYQPYIDQLSAAAGRLALACSLITVALLALSVAQDSDATTGVRIRDAALLLLILVTLCFVSVRYWAALLATAQVALADGHWLARTAVSIVLGSLGVFVLLPLTVTMDSRSWLAALLTGVINAVGFAWSGVPVSHRPDRLARWLPLVVGAATFVSYGAVLWWLSGLQAQGPLAQFAAVAGLFVTAAFAGLFIHQAITIQTA
ncbi:MAG: caspase family protein [Chloroflexi bacterium]|nr:caspase family protein [Chloroflexota bacterium]